VTSTSAEANRANPEPTNPAAPEPAALCVDPAPSSSPAWFVYQTAGAQPTVTVEQNGRAVATYAGSAVSAAGDQIAFAAAEDARRIEIHDLVTGRLSATREIEGTIDRTSVSSDGQVAVIVENLAGDRRLLEWRPSTDQIVVVRDPAANIHDAHLSVDGEAVVWSEGNVGPDATVLIAELDVFVPTELVQDAQTPRWSPDRSHVLYSSSFGDGLAIFATAVDDRATTRLTDPVDARDSDPAVSPDCGIVAFARAAGGQVDIWLTTGAGDDEPWRRVAGAQGLPSFAQGL
jgi:Tol biopolymer transport system component